MERTLDPSRVQRALEQPLYVIDNRAPHYIIQGNAGQAYELTVSTTEVNCPCMDFQRNHAICKHVIYVLSKILRIPLDTHTRLAQLLQRRVLIVPPIALAEFLTRTVQTPHDVAPHAASTLCSLPSAAIDLLHATPLQPLTPLQHLLKIAEQHPEWVALPRYDEEAKENVCCICYCDMNPMEEDLVWCHYSCGNLLHAACYKLCVRAKRPNCPQCRAKF